MAMAKRKVESSIQAKYEAFTGIERVALLLNALGEGAAASIFPHLKDNDVRKLIAVMGRLNKADVGVIKLILETYYRLLAEEGAFIFTDNVASREQLIKSLGEDRARSIFGHLSEVNVTRTLEALEVVDSRTLSNFLVNEHPQTIALIVAHLVAEKKMEVVKRLPESLQAEVIMRISNLDYISPDVIAQIDSVLKNELATIGTIEQTQLGGVQPIADMLNLMDKQSEAAVMARIDEKDPLLAEEIRKLMFVFEDLMKVDDAGIRLILREIQNDKLILALKTSDPEIRNKITRNMSQRAAQLLQEDLDSLGPVRVTDVDTAQSEIVNVARRLENEGKIVITRGGEEDAFV